MTSPADAHSGGGAAAQQKKLKPLAVTACPTGIAHTYMAAEKLQQAADAPGIEMKVETQGSIGAENVLTDNDVKGADGVIIAADKDVDRSRFKGKRVLSVGVRGHQSPRAAHRAGAKRARAWRRRRRYPAAASSGSGKERSAATRR